jgi:hypothetical protein
MTCSPLEKKNSNIGKKPLEERMYTVFDGKYPFSVIVFPVPESDLWGVSEREGGITLYHMKDRQAIVLNEARRLAQEHSIQVECTLSTFLT